MNDQLASNSLFNEIFHLHILDMLNKIHHDVMKIVYDLFMVISTQHSFEVDLLSITFTMKNYSSIFLIFNKFNILNLLKFLWISLDWVFDQTKEFFPWLLILILSSLKFNKKNQNGLIWIICTFYLQFK